MFFVPMEGTILSFDQVISLMSSNNDYDYVIFSTRHGAILSVNRVKFLSGNGESVILGTINGTILSSCYMKLHEASGNYDSIMHNGYYHSELVNTCHSWHHV
jgi:hypothetical protein